MPTNPSASSETLAHLRSQLLQACGRDPLVQTTELHLTRDGDTVYISGLVPHHAAKARIGALAGRLAPGLTIDNSCVIDASHAPPDGELADRAGDWLQRTFPDDAGTMNVIIANGKALLRGTWPNPAAVRQAKEAIGQYPGIAEVDDTGVSLRHVSSVPGVDAGPIDSIGVINQLEDELTKSGWRIGNWVDGQIERGRLTLVGVVDDEATRQRVMAIASHLKGVRRVDDQLVTRQKSSSRDRIVEARIRTAWSKAEPKVATPDLYIFVSGAQGFVGGSVDKPEAKERAIAITQKDPAIRQVIDHIRVVTRRSRPA